MPRQMKDSGIEWIGEIPQDWDKIKFKYLHNGLNTGEAIDKDYWTKNDADTFFYTAGLEPIRTCYKNFPTWKYTQENDLLLARNGTPYVYLPLSRACYTDHIIRASMKANINKKFVQYGLQQSISSVVVDSVSIATWSASLWNEQVIPFPSLELQEKIVSYLDTQCTEIDRVLEKTRASIEDYKKLKQAVITQAVTKGVRGARPMKDSGIEWIGEIPQDWKIQKMKSVIHTVSSGLSAITNDDSPETDNYVLRTSSVSSGVFKSDEVKAVTEFAISRLVCPLEIDTVVMSRMNTANMVGMAAYIDKDYDNYYLPDKLWKIKFRERMRAKYGWYLIDSNPVQGWFSCIATGTSASMQNIALPDFYTVPVPIPSVSEQAEIVAYLDAKCTAIDTLIDKKQQFLTELESYKKSLIYECVTGKREV